MIYLIPLNLITTIKIIKNVYVLKREQFVWIDILQKVTHIFYIFYLLFYFKFFIETFPLRVSLCGLVKNLNI